MPRKMGGQEWRRFVSEGTRTAKMASVRPDGRPHVAPVWFLLDGDDVVFMTGAGTVKGRDLRNDPRVALVVDDERPPYSFALVEGEATISEDMEVMAGWSTRIAARYMGEERAQEYGMRNAAPGELLVRVTPTRVTAVADMAD
ncbi:MAG: PPOX class F420-dependent oxidoreductase [Acidimicrobiales bacterium]